MNEPHLPGPKPDPDPDAWNFADYWRRHDAERIGNNPEAKRLLDENELLKKRIAELEANQ